MSQVADLAWSYLPEVYRAADAEDMSTIHGNPLRTYLDAIASPLGEPLLIAEQIAAGALTDPGMAPDEWIAWMAQVAGVGGTGIAEQRMRLAHLITAPPLGSKHYMEVLVQQFLASTRAVEVAPAPPWGIRVRVRADEIIDIGGVDGLTAALYATGLVPTGFVLQVITAQETWAQVQAQLPTWAPGEGMTWARVQSVGLAGAGSVFAGIVWAASASGPNRNYLGIGRGAITWSGTATSMITPPSTGGGFGVAPFGTSGFGV